MTPEPWVQIDEFLGELFVGADEPLQAALDASAEAGLPEIHVSAVQGKFLGLIAKVQGACSILELGTLGGYSTIWLARALPADGRLITIEAEPQHADVARHNIAAAGFSACVDVRTGPALEVLPTIETEGHRPFDLIFIDADKANTPEYFDWAVRLSRPGGLIIVDNVIRQGEVINPENADPAVQGMRRFLANLGGDSSVDATALQTVGSKGHDGFVIARIRDRG